jgi:hypothetical protein
MCCKKGRTHADFLKRSGEYSNFNTSESGLFGKLMRVEQCSSLTMWKPCDQEKQKLSVWTVTELNDTDVFTWFL